MMQTRSHAVEPTPPDCFCLEELQAFQSFETQVLADVNYYFWLNSTRADNAPDRFLYAVEFIFEQQGALLLSSGEDSTAIRIISAETLIQTARDLQTLHGQVSVQRANTSTLPIWATAVGQALHAIRLSRNEDGLYFNDALVLDFGTPQILLRLSPQDGLEITPFR